MLHLILLIAMLQFSPEGATLSNPPDETAEIKWLKLAEAEALSKKENKPLLIDFYTDWCGWCKKLDASTYKDPDVIRYVNKYFYPVKFDAESREAYSFNGEEFVFRPSGSRGTNEFALRYAARNGRLGYPTTTFMYANGETLAIVPGYQDAENMELLLRFLGEGHFENMDFAAFKSQESGANLGD